jgi:outer membrane protein OmpA-like peptidoglycan-associated protein
MRLRNVKVSLVLLAAAAPSAALAQDAQGTIEVSTPAVSADVSAPPPAPPAAPEPVAMPAAPLMSTTQAPAEPLAVQAPAAAPAVPADEPWIERHRPLPMALELGIFAGLVTPSKALDLEDYVRLATSTTDDRYHQRLQAGGTIGARAGFYPLSWLGVEAEGAITPTKTNTDDRAARLWNVNGHAVLQLPLWRIVPFVIAGVNGTGISSPILGRDTDVGGTFGGGVKLAVSEHFTVRLDARDTVLPRHVGDGLSNTGSYLFGMSYTLGRTPYAPYVPPADRDADGVADASDACPDTAGTLPNGCPPPPPDGDGDGLPDASDACPADAEDGAQPAPQDGCPNQDQDGDGVLLPADLCPAEAGVAPDGCAPKDPDGDGFAGAADKCPNEAETKNGFEDSDGCPDELPAVVAKFSGVIKGVTFENGKADIKPSSTALLDEAAGVLAQYPALRVRIVGHTDDRGKREYNVQLSQERADSVKAYLVKKGVDASRVESQGVGPDSPIADNKTPAGRAENRRIEFSLVQ